MFCNLYFFLRTKYLDHQELINMDLSSLKIAKYDTSYDTIFCAAYLEKTLQNTYDITHYSLPWYIRILNANTLT